MQQHRHDDLRRALEAEINGLLDRVRLIAAEIADADDVRGQRQQLRHEGGIVGRAEGMQDFRDRLDADGRRVALEGGEHFVAIGVVGGEIGDLLALLEGVARHRAGRHLRVHRLMEGVFREVLRLVDRVGLADRDIEHAAGARDFVDRQLHRTGERADDEIRLVLLDQLQSAGRGLAGIELVVAHKKFGHAPAEAAGVVELLDRELRAAHLILGLGAEGAGERGGKADLDRVLVGARDIRRGDEAERGGRDAALDQRATRQREVLGFRRVHVSLPDVSFVVEGLRRRRGRTARAPASSGSAISRLPAL